MSMTLTYWADARLKRTPDDFDEIRTVVLKSIRQVTDLIAQRPLDCAMISTQHGSQRTLKNGTKTDFFKIVWERGVQRVPTKNAMMVVTFPPDFDGELHIWVSERSEHYFSYNFTHARRGDEWETLKVAAQGILAECMRRIK